MHSRVIRRRNQPADSFLPQDMDPLLRRIYATRKVSSADELQHDLRMLPDWKRLTAIDTAVALLIGCLKNRKRIIVIGDFDADGATSTALAVRALRAMGAADVQYLVPNRFEFGYGLSPGIVRLAAQSHPELLITVDNGISSLEGVDVAHKAGMQVLITDHHLPGNRLPSADAIVNPNLPDDNFPAKHLAGCGVMFYVLLALRATLREQGWFTAAGLDEPRLADWLDLVALGTVADLVPLDHVNRILVEQGLRRIRAGRTTPGILALASQGNRHPADMTASDLGFTIGPRLNAAGRLTDMGLGIECLLTDDPSKAGELATRLNSLNQERRMLEAQMRSEAMSAVEHMFSDTDTTALPYGLCLYEPGWHQGLVGLVASKVKERVHRPVIAFARAGENELKGSARSVPGLHIRDALAAVGASYPGLIHRFGGHAMAAGLSLDPDKFEQFASAFDEQVRQSLSEEDLTGVLYSDGELHPREITLENAEMLRRAGPWGQAFPEPVFDGNFRLVDRRVVGDGHLKLRLSLPNEKTTYDAIAFGTTGEHIPPACNHLSVVYRLDVNEYRDARSLQLLVDYLEPA